MKQVRVSELKSQLSRHLRAAQAGETIEILDRTRPIARVVPVQGSESELEIAPAVRPFSEVRRRHMPNLRLRISSLEALRAERGER